MQKDIKIRKQERKQSMKKYLNISLVYAVAAPALAGVLFRIMFAAYKNGGEIPETTDAAENIQTGGEKDV